MIWKRALAIVLVITFVATPVSDATPLYPSEPTLIECPDHTHVWNKQQCEDNPFGLPGGTSGENGECGGLCGIIKGVLGSIGLGGIL